MENRRPKFPVLLYLEFFNFKRTEINSLRLFLLTATIVFGNHPP